MPDDPVINPPRPDPPEPEPSRKRRIRCDFCECELAADGGVLRTSEKAKQLERAEKEILDLQGRLETAQHDLEELRAPKPESIPEPQNGPTRVPGAPAKSTFVF